MECVIHFLPFYEHSSSDTIVFHNFLCWVGNLPKIQKVANNGVSPSGKAQHFDCCILSSVRIRLPQLVRFWNVSQIYSFLEMSFSVAKDVQKCTSSWHGEMVDAMDLKSIGGNTIRVRVSLPVFVI